LHSTSRSAANCLGICPIRIEKDPKDNLKMSSAYATFACGEDEPEQPSAPSMPPPPPRAPRRSTSGLAPPPPFVRHGWQGGKPPPSSLRQDIATRAAQEEGDFSDDEDYLHGEQLVKRHKDEEKKRRRDDTVCICDGLPCAGCPVHGSKGNSRSFLQEDSEEEDEEDEDDEEEWSASMPAPLPPSALGKAAAVAPLAFVAPASGAAPSNASELMGSAVREAFLSGIEQGKKMQLPTQCKTCAVRKERNRVAAKESRLKKRRETEVVIHRSQVARAADVVASKVMSARAAAGGGAVDDDKAPEPPPF